MMTVGSLEAIIILDQVAQGDHGSGGCDCEGGRIAACCMVGIARIVCAGGDCSNIYVGRIGYRQRSTQSV